MGQPDIFLAVVALLGATYFSYLRSCTCNMVNSCGTTAEKVYVTDSMTLLLTILKWKVFLILYSL